MPAVDPAAVEGLVDEAAATAVMDVAVPEASGALTAATDDEAGASGSMTGADKSGSTSTKKKKPRKR